MHGDPAGAGPWLQRDVASGIVGRALRLPDSETAAGAAALQRHGRDCSLEAAARKLLVATGASHIACEVRVEWNSRLKTCAGHVDYRRKLISLNPRLREHGFSEIDRTLRHELAHLLAQFRAGRRAFCRTVRNGARLVTILTLATKSVVTISPSRGMNASGVSFTSARIVFSIFRACGESVARSPVWHVAVPTTAGNFIRSFGCSS